jgi:hypothetical protein
VIQGEFWIKNEQLKIAIEGKIKFNSPSHATALLNNIGRRLA